MNSYNIWLQLHLCHYRGKSYLFWCSWRPTLHCKFNFVALICTCHSWPVNIGCTALKGKTRMIDVNYCLGTREVPKGANFSYSTFFRAKGAELKSFISLIISADPSMSEESLDLFMASLICWKLALLRYNFTNSAWWHSCASTSVFLAAWTAR